ncbi:MAG TPA: polyamine ABC transporter substrate-binding protein [Aestuariivirgaceae bacterium]
MRITRRSMLKTGAAAVSMPLIARRAFAQGEVRIYNWVDYIGETTVADFEKLTGMKVIYDTYDSAETVEAKVMAGSTGYDIIDMSSTTLPRFIPAGAFLKLDKSKLPNWKNLDEAVLKVLNDRDPGNQYTVPYMWGTTGITVNLDMLKEALGEGAPVDSMELLLNPKFMEKLSSCGVNILESPEDVITMTLSYLGRNPNSEDPADYDAVVEAFKPVRPYIKTFDSANYLNALPNKELCVTMSWSGDYATATTRAEEAGVKLNLAYNVPQTGSPAWFDVFVIPADSPNPDGAHQFLNYMMEPEVIAKCTNFTNYAHANKAAIAFTDKSVLEDPAVFPSDDIKKRLYMTATLSQKAERVRTRAWNKIKTGS